MAIETGELLDEAPPTGRGHPMSEAEFNASVTAGTPTAPKNSRYGTGEVILDKTPSAAAATRKPYDWKSDEPYGDSKSVIAAATKGVAGPLMGAAQLVSKGLKGTTSLGGLLPNPVSNFWSGNADAIDAQIKELNDAARSWHAGDSPKTELTGSMISPPNVLGGKAAGAVAKVGNVTKAAITGAVAAASNPVEDIKNYWSHKLVDIGLGGGTGAVLGKAGDVAGSALNPIVQKAVKVLQDHGVDVSKMTLGQLLGGGARKFEDWMRDMVPLNKIGEAQQAGNKEFMVAPVRKAMENINRPVEGSALMPDILGKAQQDLNTAYKDAVGTAPLIAMKAVPNAAGTGYKKNVGSMAFFNNLMKSAEDWTKVPNGAKQASTDGDKAFTALSTAIQNTALKPFKPSAPGGSYSYSDPKELHTAIKTLNTEINDVYQGLSKGNPAFGTTYTRPYLEQLEKVRDHLRDLWEKSDKSSFSKLRSADAANAGVSTVQDASAAARKVAGEYTPEQLIEAGRRSSQSARRTAAGDNPYQRYAMAGQDVLGNLEPGKHGFPATITGAAFTPASALINPIYNSGALSRYALNQSGLRRAAGEMLRDTPQYLGGLGAMAGRNPAAHRMLTGHEE